MYGRGGEDFVPTNLEVAALVGFSWVVEYHGDVAILERFGPRLKATVVVVLQNSVPCGKKPVLVDGDYLRIHQDAPLRVAHVSGVCREDKRRRPERPKAELRFRVNVVHHCLVVPRRVLQHKRHEKVGIEVGELSGVFRGLKIAHPLDDVGDALAVADALCFRGEVPQGEMIHLNSEHLPDVTAPLPNVVNSPFAEGEQHGVVRRVQLS
mmetsp:Transcript_23239/g.43663  ORF Transcript_23239/g.43663 Transcript_23239/m.43663 type:complete len:209 (-) Transcript_23239:687-1313(-)